MTMQSSIVANEFRITQNDPNFTAYTGVANTLTKVVQYSVPQSTALKIRQGDVLSLDLQTAVPAQIVDGSQCRLVITDANEVYSNVIAEGTYQIFKEFTNRNTIYAFSSQYNVGANMLIQLWVNASTVIASANTVFQLSCVRATANVPV
jgi:hypothetical protein|tara:strand:- start:754 stop:1200 length:447 start_codon:yes stop_codon:yes gene_type:complete